MRMHLLHLFIIFFNLSANAIESFNFHGKLSNISNLNSTITLNIKIIIGSSCIVFEESHSNVTSYNSNEFSIAIGNGNVIFNQSNGNDIFDFSTSKNCKSSVDYSPSVNDLKTLKVTISNGSDSLGPFDFLMRPTPNSSFSKNSGNSLALSGKKISTISPLNNQALIFNSSLNLFEYKKVAFYESDCTAGQFLSWVVATGWTCTNLPVISDLIMAGDVTGNTNGNFVVKIQGRPVSNVLPISGQYLKWDGNQWVPDSISSSVTSVAGKTGTVTLTSADITGLANVAVSGNYSDLNLKPSTLLGYGITDAQPKNSELTGLSNVVSNGILLRNSSGSYSSLGVISPLLLVGSDIGLNIGTSSGSVAAGNDSRFGDANKINGKAIDLTNLSNGSFLSWDGSNQKWISTTMSSAVTSVAGKTGAVTLTSADISGLANSATSDTTDASNISSGILPVGRLPAMSGDVVSVQGTNSLSLNTVTILKGGTGANNKIDAINALLPSQTTQGGKFLKTDGTNVSWENERNNFNTRSVNSNISTNVSDNIIITDATLGAFSVQLHSASSNLGAILKIISSVSTSNAVTIIAFGTEKICGKASVTIVGAYDSVVLQSDGNNWIGENCNKDPYNMAGMVASFAMSACPQGWLIADGSAISRSIYSTLFSALGTIYGSGDGSTTFNLPNLMGVFVRGVGSQIISSKTYTGGTIGTKQTDSTAKNGLSLTDPGHSHNQSVTTNVGGGVTSALLRINDGQNGAVSTSSYTSNSTTGITITSSDSETKPANIALRYCIKY